MTVGQFAKEIGNVSREQLRRTLNDPRNSAPLTAKIDAFCDEHVGKQRMGKQVA